MGKQSNNVKTDRFFLTPNKNWRLGSPTAWYKNLPVGVNTLSPNGQKKPLKKWGLIPSRK
jgi:hypothetical protein